jgi:hypothetical protein
LTNKDRTSQFAFVELVERADMRTAATFLEALIAAVPYRIHTVPTDIGIQFADLAKNRGGLTARGRGHPFDRTCWSHGTRPSPHQAESPLDQRSGRTNESHHQGSHGEALLLPNTSTTQNALV